MKKDIPFNINFTMFSNFLKPLQYQSRRRIVAILRFDEKVLQTLLLSRGFGIAKV